MRKVIERTGNSISLEPMFEGKGLLMVIHGEVPSENSVVSLTLHEARILAYGLLAEAERQA